jgi:hypothetical protein
LSETPEYFGLLSDQIMQIKIAMSADDVLRVFVESDILLKTLGEEFLMKHEFQELKSNLEIFLNNPDNFRVLRLYCTIKTIPEMNLEYLNSPDKGRDPRLWWQEQMEIDITAIYAEIRKLCAIVMKTKFADDWEL